jgi:hypothetical protein
MLGFFTSCTESSAPADQSKLKGLTIAALSPTAINATVGAAITDLPTVVTRDTFGNPVSGITVKFVVTAPDGTSRTKVEISNANGIAKLSEWSLAGVPGNNVVVASIPTGLSIEFRAAGSVGAPALMERVTGDGQEGSLGLELTIVPTVRVTDGFHNPLTGVPVSFAIVRGSGRLSSEDAITDDTGTARAGKWTLLEYGDHRLQASSPGVPSVTFLASAFRSDIAPCTIFQNLAERNVFQSILDESSCGREGGSYAAVALAPLVANEYVFRMHSDEFDAYLELTDPLGRVIAVNDNASDSTTDSEIRAMVPSGGVTLVASSARTGGHGKYTMTYMSASAGSSCQNVFVTRGLAVYRTIRDICAATNSTDHSYLLYLRAGEMVTVTVEDLAYADWRVDFFDPSKSAMHLANKTPLGYFYTYDLQATRSGYYTIRVGSYAISDYNFIIK